MFKIIADPIRLHPITIEAGDIQAAQQDGQTWNSLSLLVETGDASVDAILHTLGKAGMTISVSRDEIMADIQALQSILRRAREETDLAKTPDVVEEAQECQSIWTLMAAINKLDERQKDAVIHTLEDAFMIQETGKSASEYKPLVGLPKEHPAVEQKDHVYRYLRDRHKLNADKYNIGGEILREHYTLIEHWTWRQVFEGLEQARPEVAVDGVDEAVEALGMTGKHVPQLADLSNRLENETGFHLIPCADFLPSGHFLILLTYGFPCTNYVRHYSAPKYTPEPDVCHELLGHLPILRNEKMAKATSESGVTMARLSAQDDVRAIVNGLWEPKETDKPRFETIDLGKLRKRDEEECRRCVGYGQTFYGRVEPMYNEATNDAFKAIVSAAYDSETTEVLGPRFRDFTTLLIGYETLVQLGNMEGDKTVKESLLRGTFAVQTLKEGAQLLAQLEKQITAIKEKRLDLLADKLRSQVVGSTDVEDVANSIIRFMSNTVSRCSNLYWHTVEFGVLKTAKGVRAYGAGLLSGFGELETLEKRIQSGEAVVVSVEPDMLPGPAGSGGAVSNDAAKTVISRGQGMQYHSMAITRYNPHVYQPVYMDGGSTLDEAATVLLHFLPHWNPAGTLPWKGAHPKQVTAQLERGRLALGVAPL